MKKHHFRSKNIQEVTSYLQKYWEDCISLKKPIPAFQIEIFDNENECKMERMNCLEKFKLKHYDNLQTTKSQEEENNDIQSSLTGAAITYKECNETISSETPSKNNLLMGINRTILHSGMLIF